MSGKDLKTSTSMHKTTGAYNLILATYPFHCVLHIRISNNEFLKFPYVSFALHSKQKRIISFIYSFPLTIAHQHGAGGFGLDGSTLRQNYIAAGRFPQSHFLSLSRSIAVCIYRQRRPFDMGRVGLGGWRWKVGMIPFGL